MCQQGLCLLLVNTICLFLMYSTSLAHPLLSSPALPVFAGGENYGKNEAIGRKPPLNGNAELVSSDASD